MSGPAVTIGPGARIPLRYLTRHVGIFGATGTGKTTAAAALVERIAAAGVPVLILDAKGDLESLAPATGGALWDCTGRRGEARRLDLGRMGPDLIARALDLSDAQSGVLEIAHAFARSRGLALASLDDLKNALGAVVNSGGDVAEEFGLVSPASVAAVQRSTLRLRRTAPDAFGGPALDPFGAERRREDRRGCVTVLRAAPLTATPGLYGAAAAHILDALYQGAGELGDVPAPGLAVFVDEAHLIFDGAPAAIRRRMETVARLIRSKGIALIFASQSPADLPDAITGQLATRIQHGLRGATRAQIAAIKAAAQTMPASDGADLFDVIRGLGVGEALISAPGRGGTPSPAARVRVQPGRINAEPLPDSYFPDAPPPISPTPSESPISPTPSESPISPTRGRASILRRLTSWCAARSRS